VTPSHTPNRDGVRVNPLRYEIRVEGELTNDDLGALGGLAAHLERAGTILVGDVADRAALHGMLHRLRALDLELIEVRRLPSRGT
jgi:hypothetical protein